jgi:hypothetical protein
VVRAYYIGHLGKYVPGKAWALFLRASLAGGPGVSPGYAGLTAFYEVLTTMAAGALLAAVLLAFLMPDMPVLSDSMTWQYLFTSSDPTKALHFRWPLVLLALCLFVPIALPLVPPLFNRLAHRLSLPFREKNAGPLARLESRGLPEGLLLTMVGWALLGASTWAALRATAPELHWSLTLWGRITAFMGIAYVLGFAALVMPGGLGVRELFLTLLLVPELLIWMPKLDDEAARQTVVAAVVVLRVTWTVAELLLAGVVFWLPVPRAPAAKGGVA